MTSYANYVPSLDPDLLMLFLQMLPRKSNSGEIKLLAI